MNNLEIIFIDDNIPKNQPILTVLKKKYGEDNIKIFENSNKGLEYILANMHKLIVVVLDMNFPANEDSGKEILSKLRVQNRLIPVIMWSAKDDTTSIDFENLINNHALYYLKKTSTLKNFLEKIENAIHQIETDVATAISIWLEKQDDKNKTLMIKNNGKAYTANALIEAIRLQTEEGRKIEINLLKLTIDLLFREKESL